MTQFAAPSSGSVSAHHIDALDGVRGFAVALVLLSHGAEMGLLPAVLGNGLGQMGVTLFFALSGFLISHLYLTRPLTAPECRRYLIRRAARVLPLYFAALAIAGVLVLIGLTPFGIFTGPDFVLSASLLKGKGIFWAIPVEVHFYLLFLLIWWGMARGAFGLALTAVLVLQVALAAAAQLAQLWPDLLWLRKGLSGGSLVKWLHIFLFGLLLARHQASLRNWAGDPRRRRVVTALSWLVFAFGLLTPPELRRMVGLPVLPNFIDPITAGYPVVLMVGVVAGQGPFRLFRRGALRGLGKISYGLYLLHLPMFALTVWLVAEGALPLAFGFVTATGLSVLIATASLHWFEQPVQHHIQRRAAPPVLTKVAPRARG